MDGVVVVVSAGARLDHRERTVAERTRVIFKPAYCRHSASPVASWLSLLALLAAQH